MPKTKPYGTWKSPITPSMMAGQKRLSDVAWSGDGNTLLWVEGRGAEGVVVAKGLQDAPRDLSEGVNVRGGVGYGGGELAAHGDSAFFAGSDGALHRAELDYGRPRCLTPAFGKVASPALSPDGQWIAYVYTDGAVDLIACVDARGQQWPSKLVLGADFYMQPTWSADGARLAWIAWDHPKMPWSETRLETAEVRIVDGRLELGEVEVWAGGDDVAIQEPGFSPDGRHLAYLSDESGYMHVYVRDLQSGKARQLTEGECDWGGPAWVQGLRHLSWHPDGEHLYGVRNERGRMRLMRVSVDGVVEEVRGTGEYEAITQPAVSASGKIAFIGSSSAVPPRVVVVDEARGAHVHARATNERISPDRLSSMEPVSWTAPVDGGSVEIFANYYAPTNPDFESAGKPPALVMVHGGPTSQRTAAYEARNQFFATRGWAVLDVNYRGSTGYGRAYADALLGQWGVADVEDVVSAAGFLVDAGLADAERLVVMGGSAGGYTVLQTLVNHPGTFKAGVCLYGIANLFTLAAGTHKFEASYNDLLIGPLPDAAPLYRERSPIFRADRITDAVAVYHGAEDRVVPLDQAEAIVESLRSRDVPHVYHVYEDEGHGWRRAKNIRHFYESLQSFLLEQVIYG